MAAFDLIVVGAGHAGCEAAAAAARMGASVALVTLARETVAQMPCNPAIGGIGKGHLVVEIDALGGLQGWAADRAGIQFKELNRSRGPAVWGPRAQCDKEAYGTLMRRVVAGLRGVQLIEGEVRDLKYRGERVSGVDLSGGRAIEGRAVILTTGTFLGGVLHTGDSKKPGGRYGEQPSTALGKALELRGIKLRRFKTGTPPRLAEDSLDLSRLEIQEGDRRPRAFSWRTREVQNRRVCWITRTPREVQRIIGDNIGRSPLFSGSIDGVGPRYCPSIEDKVVRFPHHERHTVFLEPEGLSGNSIYLNGLSTSLPADIQKQVVRAIPGLEKAAFLRYGYAVEYDVVAPQQVGKTLESKAIPGLYLAGQLVGTSGYEEAAALGFVAGVNAVLGIRGEGEFCLGREDAYIGVLVDDVCGREHREPYRMFTSRAEHRLVLGVDSARERLMAKGADLGLVRGTVFHVERARWAKRRGAREALEGARLNPDRETREDVRRRAGVELRSPTTWAQILRRQDVDAVSVAAELSACEGLNEEDRRIVVGLLRYDGYLARHERERERLHRLRDVPMPENLDLSSVPGISREVAEAVALERPRTLADAERVAGMTPAAAALIAGRIANWRRKT